MHILRKGGRKKYMKITLKAARVNKNLMQSEAAERIGVTKKTIKNWESYKTFPNAVQISKIEETYEVEYNDIIFLPNNNP